MAGRWDGATLYMSRDGGVSYQELDFNADAGSFGIATTALSPFTSTGMFDNTNSVDVSLTVGTDAPPTTLADADVLAGGNGAIIGDEYIQYGTVVNLGSNQYRLSRLLRGRRGTDFYWDKHVVGERAVLDNGGIKRFVLPADLAGTTILLKAAGQGQSYTDIVTPTVVHVYGRELTEYAPVQLTGSRDGSQNITLNWVRRARKLFDLRDGADIPQDTLLEQYVVQCLSASSTSVTGITNARPMIAALSSHNFAVGQAGYFTGITGMIELNGVVANCIAVDPDTVHVTFDLDTTGFGTFTGTGAVWRSRRAINVTVPTASYPSTSQISDFGSNQNPLQVTVQQLADSGIPGYALAGFI